MNATSIGDHRGVPDGRKGLKPARPRVTIALLTAVMLWLGAHITLGETSLPDLSRVLRRCGVDDGLIGGRADAVVQTPDRHVWVGTEDGLFRFNGASFERIDTARVPELGHSWVTRLCVDADGSIWVGNAIGRIAVYSDGRFTAVNPPTKGMPTHRWTAHPGGGILATVGAGPGNAIARFTRSGAEVLVNAEDSVATAVHVDRKGRTWIARAEGPIAELRGGALETGANVETLGVGAFVEKRDGSLVAFGRRGIYALLDDRWTVQSKFEAALEEMPTFAVEDLDGRVWFGGRQSGRMVLLRDGSLRRLRIGRDSLPAVILSTIADADGDLWFATFSGLFQARYVPFVSWKPPPEMPSERVVGLSARPDGTVSFYGPGGMSRLVPGAARPVRIAARPTAELTIGDADESGALWLGNRDGIFIRRIGETDTRVPVRTGGARSAPGSLIADRDGVAWCAAGNSIYACDPRREPLAYIRVSGNHGLPDGVCHRIRMTSNGDLLVAALGQGVFRRRLGGDVWALATPAGDAAAAEVEILDQDDDGRIWGFVRRQNRIGCWDPRNSFTASLDELGIAPARVNGLAVDDFGGLWLATRENGVVTLDREEFLATARDSGKRPALTWFGTVDGLGSLGGSYAIDCIARSPDGRIWVATDGGLSAIDPRLWAAERARAAILATRISECVADGVSLDLAGAAQVPAGTARVELNFSALSFGFPGEVKYRYRLRGFDDEWSSGGARGEARFQRLRAGNYVFEVAAANRFGVWNPNPAQLVLTVQPYWWQRTDVQLAGALLLALAVAAVVRARANARRSREALRAEFSRQLIVSQEEERKRISRELHDSLGQNLLVAKNQLYLTREMEFAPRVQEKLGRIAESVDAALEEARAISHQLRPFQLERLGLTKALRAMIRETADSTKIPIETEIDELGGLLPETSEAMLYRIVQEALSNIVRHADASRVQVQAARAGNILRLVVRDDGRGFDPRTVLAGEHARRGLGLAGFSERANLLGGRFRCQSSPGHGTVLTFEIPIPTAGNHEATH